LKISLLAASFCTYFESTAGDGTTNVAFSEDKTLLCEGGALRNPSAHGDFPPEVEPGADA
jgi:hypothetical protein